LTIAIKSIAQDSGFTIAGKITEQVTGNSLAYVSVFLEPTGRQSLSDQNGDYTFSSVPVGEYLLVVKISDFNVLTKAVAVVNASTIADLTMIPTSPDVISPVVSRQVEVQSSRADAKTPMAYTGVSKEQIKVLNNGQDMPYMLRFTPSLIATSDAGNGVGYTGLWIRGSDPSRINVTVNDIPINDPESQQVFWVNMPDLASSADVQVQRGVGTSSNGAASFGGSIRVGTNFLNSKPYAELINSYGSFNTLRNTLMAGTGLIADKFTVDVRLSHINSDGYIDRASSDLKSFYTAAARYGKSSTLKLVVFGGAERTYQSWYGSPVSRLTNDRDSMLTHASNNGLTEKETENLLNSGRTYNYYTYRNQVDDYKQTHYQLHYSNYFNKIILNAAAHYTNGSGFYEEYKEDESFGRYGLNDVVIVNDTITETDVVRRRWLRNHFFGTVGSLNYKTKKQSTTLGWSVNGYIGEHYGEFVWMQFAGENFEGDRYYQGNSNKSDASAYIKSSYSILKNLDVYADLQVRNINYVASGVDNDIRNYIVDDQFLFFNPKAGINYQANKKSRLYASFAVGNKEPNRNDYIDASPGKTPKHETMYDTELGYQCRSEQMFFGLNFYNMHYDNQLVLTGAVNDVGAPVRINVNDSYRRGIEIEFGTKWKNLILWNANLTLSQNRILKFDESIIDYTEGYDVRITKYEDTEIAFSPSVSGASNLQVNLWQRRPATDTESFKLLSLRLLTKYVGKQYLDNTANDALAIAPYFVNDVQLMYDVKSTVKTSWTISFNVNNAFDSMYSSNGYAFSYIAGNRINEAFYYPQAGRHFMVTVGVKV